MGNCLFDLIRSYTAFISSHERFRSGYLAGFEKSDFRGESVGPIWEETFFGQD